MLEQHVTKEEKVVPTTATSFAPSLEPFFVITTNGVNKSEETTSNDNPEDESPDLVFKPIVSLDSLPVIDVKTCEEEEIELLKVRGKLYRFCATESEWKERGLGDVKFLKHPSSKQVRILMRREKTLKMCANHYINHTMELKPHAGNDKAFVWSTLADFIDDEPTAETLCIRFGNVEKAHAFRDAFNQAKQEAVEREASQTIIQRDKDLDKVQEPTFSSEETEDAKESVDGEVKSDEAAKKEQEQQVEENSKNSTFENIEKRLENIVIKTQ
jgi:Ran-binding protein 1